uniref:PEM-3 KH domain protein n=1 Tax=Phallusia mammillata TaxID=59560 RepID=C9DQK9_9ASCI|nr:PEM-3 KH domain protein [Phallusia mammillata]CAB3263777.1 RNA-binding protein MEX3B [Phallusia mammillata]
MKAEVVMQSPTVFSEPTVGSTQEDQRALQIALELSNLGLLGNCDDDGSTSSFDEAMKNKKSQNMTECVPVPSSEHVAEIVGRQGCKIKALRAKTNTYIKTPVRGEEPVFVVTGRKEDVAMARREVQSAAEHFTQIRASRNRHAALMNGHNVNDGNAGTKTLQVRVPYRVVGLVVGPKGATIKRIQQQTHTYIVTPSRDKEPVFEVTGLPENVEKAKEEIEAHIAARTGTQQVSVDDDFKNNGTEVGSPLQAQIKPTSSVSNALYKTSSLVSTSSAFLPYNTNNVNSALRSQAPSFIPSNAGAQNLHQSDLLSMSQANQMNNNLDSSFAPNFIPGFSYSSSAFEQADNIPSTVLGSIAGLNTTPAWSTGSQNNQPDNINSAATQFPFTPMRSSSATGSTGGSTSSGFSPTSSYGNNGLQRLSPTLSDPDFSILPPFMPSNINSHNPVRRVGSDSVDSSTSSIDHSSINGLGPFSSFAMTPALNIESGYSSGEATDSLTSGSPIETSSALSHLTARAMETTGKQRLPQRCIICGEGSVVAALVPCGHNNFCYTCANEVVSQPCAACPCCKQTASMALLIKK